MTTATREAKPGRMTYASLVAGSFERNVPIAPDTLRVIGLRPGRFLEVTPEDRNMHPARARWNSAIRTARLRTGRRYRVVTRNGGLYVVCLKVEKASEEG